MNDADAAVLVREVACELVGAEQVDDDFRIMASEDAAYFLQQAPGVYVDVGTGNHEKGIDAPQHNPRHQIDEDALPLATALLTASALKMLGH